VVTDPYAVQFFAYAVRGLGLRGQPELAWAELVAVRKGGMVPRSSLPDALHGLTPSEFASRELDAPDPEAL